MRERQMKRKYAKSKERARKIKLEKIRAMEMLMENHGCRWDDRLGCFIVQDFNEAGISTKTRFLNLQGEEIENPVQPIKMNFGYIDRMRRYMK